MLAGFDTSCLLPPAINLPVNKTWHQWILACVTNSFDSYKNQRKSLNADFVLMCISISNQYFFRPPRLFIVSENEMEGQLYMADWGM